MLKLSDNVMTVGCFVSSLEIICKINVFSRDLMITGGVWIGNWIYGNLTERNYK
jgi:hypothetical protein